MWGVPGLYSINTLILNDEQFIYKLQKFSENTFFKSLFLSDRKEWLSSETRVVKV